MRRVDLVRIASALCVVSLALVAPSGAAQTPPPPATGEYRVLEESEIVKVPSGVILIKGAEPSATDSSTPLPEGGQVIKSVYRNDYFGLRYALPADWSENFSGPPPSDSGTYVLALLGPSPSFKGTSRATILIQAHDLFFSLSEARSARELAAYAKDVLEPFYAVEKNPAQVRIAGRAFTRFDYKSEAAGLHWVVLTTEIRCHAVQFILTSSDVELLERLIKDMDAMQIATDAAPVCMADYAMGTNVTSRVDPVMTGSQKFNPIPVRFVIDKRGRVGHIHLISAFPEQAKSITAALTQWTFKPREVNGERVEVETGLLFGYAPPWPKRAKGTAGGAADQ
jgi:hypothetical protein